MSEVTLEAALNELAKDSDNAEEFLREYEQTKSYLEQQIYPWVQANCSWFTDHGRQHIDAVINQASRLLEDELRNVGDNDLTELDIFILLTSILWHDVGMIVDRSEHDQISTDVFDELQTMGAMSPNVKRVITDIIKAHRGDSGLDIPQKNTSFTINGKIYKIYPKALAGILRFSDEISETQERVSSDRWVRDTVPVESRIFWRYAQTIQSCYPLLNGKAIKVVIGMEVDDAIEMYPCPDSFEHRGNQNGEISLIQYIICRLEKLINELAYCERYFNRYVEIRDVELTLTIRGSDQTIEHEINETLGAAGLTKMGTYPSVTIYDEFFNQYSRCKPDNLPSGSNEDGQGGENYD
ncbi:hypothetical protein [Haladaptatus sp. AB643]|uniref:HD domain-containing protein n=1 Tax=Haladaptatus sp. AB643 TaxID=2934174 RepID=UPI00209C5375|nr:hypothetical protein [Haladaptatus sp. AB643]MCO8242960.1 hypothetical protein [Haladaptatus sp. AB643]